MYIILERNKHKINYEISDTQSGFRKNIGTREGIFNLRTIIERNLEKQKRVFACFIDYAKAFDNVQHESMIECLSRIGVDGKDIRILANLYWEQTATMNINGELSREFPVQKGVRQGCVFSPFLFNLYTEEIFDSVRHLPGIKIGGVNINTLRYADDTVLLAECEEDLRFLIEEILRLSEKFGLSFNFKKTKIMVISGEKVIPHTNIVCRGNKLEQVKKYIYLGHMITENGKTEEEVKRRIEIARSTFTNMKKLLTSRDLGLQTRLRLCRCYVWSTLLYGVETWTLYKNSERSLAAFEMWTLRRILRIPWTEKRTNSDVLELVGGGRNLMELIRKRIVTYFGHILRQDCLQKTLLEGTVAGTRKRGRQRKEWGRSIEDWTFLSYEESSREAQHRTWWKRMVVDLLVGEDT